jgi:hypothetical protein
MVTLRYDKMSILRTRRHVTLYLGRDAASLLERFAEMDS